MSRNIAHKALAVALVAACAMGLASPASAWWRAGWGWGGVGIAVVPPVVVPPPVVVAPPPVIYAAPPVVAVPAAPPPVVYRAGGRSCDAGAYICPLDQPASIGTTCSCATKSGQPVYGTVR